MENSGVKYVLGAMARLLRPLVKMLIQKGISYDQAADILRKTYCDVAFDGEFALPGRKQTDSRVSVLTGLTRKDVARLKEMPLDSPGLIGTHNRATRVVTGWWLDYPSEGTASGAAPLSIEGEKKSFAEMVRKYSGDMPVRAVLDELVRTGAVQIRGDQVELVSRRYIPEAGEINRIEYLGIDVAELIATISHNLNAPADKTHLQRKVYYDNIPAEHVESIHAIVRELAVGALDTAKQKISRFDRDMNPSIAGSGRQRVSFGLYFNTQAFEADKDAANASPHPKESKPKRIAKNKGLKT
jgi:Family of unknown function (DUF6502)